MGIFLSRGPTASEAEGEEDDTSNVVSSVKETSVSEIQTCPPKESKPSPSRSPKRKGVTFGPTSTATLESKESPPASSSSDSSSTFSISSTDPVRWKRRSTPRQSKCSAQSSAETVVKENVSENGKGGPTETSHRNERDGRSYKEALRGPEDNTMSELQVPGPAWRFCEAPEEQKMPLQECLQESRRDWQGQSRVREVQAKGLQKQDQETHEIQEM
jgi:hypothetical protein